MAQQESNATHWVLGGALLLIGLFVIIALVMIRSQATDITATVNNSAPTVSNVKLCAGATASSNAGISGCSDITSVTLTAGTTTAVSLVAQVTDANGTDDLDTVATNVFYHSDTTSACSADNNDCYTNDAECYQITPVIDSTNAWYRCDMALEYFTDDSTDGAEEWDQSFLVEDAADAQGTYTTYTTEVAELVAGTFPDVAFGSVALGFSSVAANNQDVTHQHTGNVDALDITVALDNTDTNSAVDCSTGTIPVGNFDFDTDNGGSGDGDQGDGTALTTSAQDLDIDIAQRTNDGSSQGPTNPFNAGDDQAYSYWNILVPSTGVLGSCSETLNVTFKEAP